MKKIALFACTMLLCAGVAMAQEPVKKTNNSKPQTENATVAKPAKSEAQAAHKGCGNCPNHKQCGNHAQANAAKPEAKPADKPCCKKEGQKACNKEADKKACNKSANNNAAATK